MNGPQRPARPLLALLALLLAALLFPADFTAAPGLVAVVSRTAVMVLVLVLWRRAEGADAASISWPVVLLAILIGRYAFDVSNLWICAQAAPVSFGTTFADMSRDPFALLGLFPHRLLGPVIAHAIGCGGERYGQFMHAVTSLWIGAIFLLARRHGAGTWGSAAIAVGAAFSGVVALYKGYVGYADPMTFLLLTLGLVALRSRVLFWVLLLLNLLAHEHVLFVLPWLLCTRRAEAAVPWRLDGTGLAVVLGLYALFRIWVGAHLPPSDEERLTLDYYLKYHYFPLGWIGLVLLAMMNTVVVFGPLILLLPWWPRAAGSLRERLLLWLLLTSVALIFVAAHDTFRFINFLAPPMIAAAARMLAAGRGALLAGLYAAALVAWPLQGDHVVPVVVHEMLYTCFAQLDPTRGVLLTCLVPRLWYIYAAYLLAVAALWFAGNRLGRRGPGRIRPEALPPW